MARYRTTPDLTPLWLLIVANVVVYLFTVADSSLVHSLGLQPASIDQRPWTIVTSIFVHANFGHILMNMITLFFFGSYTIRLVGQWAFLLVYFAGGLVGSLFYMAIAPSYSTAVGASGAIFALGGTLAMLVPKDKIVIFPVPVPVPLWTAIIGGFLILMVIPNVAWQAHLGGLVLGLAAGYVLKRNRWFFF